VAIAFRSESHITPGSGTSPTVAEPSGATSGDFLLALFVVDSPGGTPGLPSGWTSLNSGASSNTHFRYEFGYIVRGGSAPSYTFTHTGTTYRELYVVCYSGVDATPIDSQGTEVKTSQTSEKPDPPSTTAVDSAAMAIAAHLMWGGAPASGGWTAPTNYTLRSGNIGGCAGAIADRQLAAAGAENPGQFGGTPQAGDDGWAQTITLEPSSGSPASTSPVVARRRRGIAAPGLIIR